MSIYQRIGEAVTSKTDNLVLALTFAEEQILEGGNFLLVGSLDLNGTKLRVYDVSQKKSIYNNNLKTPVLPTTYPGVPSTFPPQSPSITEPWSLGPPWTITSVNEGCMPRKYTATFQPFEEATIPTRHSRSSWEDDEFFFKVNK